MKINNTVLDVLGNCRVEENVLFLPANLDRKVYTDVNKVLEALGGKWNRKAGGHVFDHCPADEIDEAILTGECTDRKKEYCPECGKLLMEAKYESKDNNS